MKIALANSLLFSLLILSFAAQASDYVLCDGTVLQRRFALVQFGQLADTYISAKGSLPDICAAPVAGVSDSVPNLLKNASVCGSSKEGAVYYSCQIAGENSPVIETCRYSLVDQSMSCENRTVITTIED